MSRFGEFVRFVTNVKDSSFAGYMWHVEFFEAYRITYKW